jgi:hypothetical protein
MGRFIEALERRNLFTVYWVDTLSDNADDADGFADGLLSLREAVIAAGSNVAWGDAAAGEAFARDIIRFDPWVFGGTILLTQGQLTINDRMTIDGGGLGAIDGGSTGIFDVLADNVEIRNLTLVNANDAAIYVAGANNVVSGVDFFDNQSLNSTVGGGAIFLDGLGVPSSLTVTNSYFDGNRAAVDGGAIVVDGPATLLIEFSTFINNAAINPTSHGGAVASRGGTVEIFGSEFRGNSAGGGGALSVNGGTMSVERSTLQGNVGVFGGAARVLAGTLDVTQSFVNFNIGHVNGGAFYNAGALNINGSHVRRNTSLNIGSNGGGVYNDGGAVYLYRSIVKFNAAQSSGGAIYNAAGTVTAYGSDLSDNRAVMGGGIAIASGNVTLDRSFLNRNRAIAPFGSEFISPGLGGGAYLSSAGATLTLTGSVVANNRANEGGGIWMTTGTTLTASISRIRGNRATTFVGGGIFSEGLISLSNSWVAMNSAKTEGGGIYTELNGVTTLQNVVVRKNRPINFAGGGTVTQV